MRAVPENFDDRAGAPLDVAAHRSLVRASDEATTMSEAPSCITGVLVPSVRSEPYLNRRIEVQPRCLVTPARHGRASIARAWSLCSPAHHSGSRGASPLAGGGGSVLQRRGRGEGCSPPIDFRYRGPAWPVSRTRSC